MFHCGNGGEMVARWKVVASFLLAETFVLASITQLRGCLADPVPSPAVVDLSGSFPRPIWTHDAAPSSTNDILVEVANALKLTASGEALITFTADGGAFARDGGVASDKEIARSVRQWAATMLCRPTPSGR